MWNLKTTFEEVIICLDNRSPVGQKLFTQVDKLPRLTLCTNARDHMNI